jgi:hypothetical protein
LLFCVCDYDFDFDFAGTMDVTKRSVDAFIAATGRTGRVYGNESGRTFKTCCTMAASAAAIVLLQPPYFCHPQLV